MRQLRVECAGAQTAVAVVLASTASHSMLAAAGFDISTHQIFALTATQPCYCGWQHPTVRDLELSSDFVWAGLPKQNCSTPCNRHGTYVPKHSWWLNIRGRSITKTARCCLCSFTVHQGCEVCRVIVSKTIIDYMSMHTSCFVWHQSCAILLCCCDPNMLSLVH